MTDSADRKVEQCGPAVSHRVVTDIAFSTIPGYRPLSLDLHLPERSSAAPVVIFIHGGGWLVGSRKQFCNFPQDETFGRLVREGWAVASIDYRLSSEAAFPAQLQDVHAALRWVRSYAADYHLDSTAVAVWGESAGGHLAALVAFEPDADLMAVIDWYGPTDLASLPALATPAGPPTREARLLGADPLSDPARTRAASPLYCVRRDAPSFFVAHGLADEAVPPSQSERLAAALRAFDVDVELQLVPDAGHIWAGLTESSVVMDPAMRFLADALRRVEQRNHR